MRMLRLVSFVSFVSVFLGVRTIMRAETIDVASVGICLNLVAAALATHQMARLGSLSSMTPPIEIWLTWTVFGGIGAVTLAFSGLYFGFSGEEAGHDLPPLLLAAIGLFDLVVVVANGYRLERARRE